MTKKMDTIVNVTVMVAGIAMAALSNNKNFSRRISAMKKASANVSRQIANEKIIAKKEAEIVEQYKEILLTNQYIDRSSHSITYGEFFLLRQAASSVYGDEDQQITIGKWHTDDGEHFLAHERFVAGGKLFIFISSEEDEALYDGGCERHMSYIRICQAHKNFDGYVYVFDAEKVKKEEPEIWKYGEHLVSEWKAEKSKEASGENRKEIVTPDYKKDTVAK